MVLVQVHVLDTQLGKACREEVGGNEDGDVRHSHEHDKVEPEFGHLTRLIMLQRHEDALRGRQLHARMPVLEKRVQHVLTAHDLQAFLDYVDISDLFWNLSLKETL